MAVSYDNRKKSYDAMDDSQKQQYNNMLSQKSESHIGNQYLKQWQQEQNNQQQTSNESNFNNQAQPYNIEKAVDNTQKAYTGGNKQPTDMTAEEYRNSDEYKNSQWKLYEWQIKSEVSPDLDQSKFNEAPWQISVKEWTAAQTGKPDYTISTDARLNEMKSNLDQYFQDSPRMFSDRETFNRVFDYNNRESDAQRQLLDSYWKRKEDMDKASQYTSWESIMNWLNNSEITTDQLNLIKDTNPEAYRKRQELQEEEIKKRIVNSIVPPLLEEISQNMVNMMNNLWIQPQEAEDIEWVYNDTMDRTQAWQTMEDANRTVKRIEEVNNKRTAIMNRYANSTWWTVSDALAAARMQKALAPYDTEMQGLQYQYQDYANLFSQKQAAAYQAAQVRWMQANENQRIWNQRLTALWFAQTAMSYRTPEQQAQLRLQEQQAQNEMQLLQQSRLNDLNRYNAYATAKMQNQLQAELTDLSVEDENQLKANLNNVLSDYYKQYWDIIQRSQPQVVDDIIAYAKKNWISVAQALSENFIKPLQNKAEYKQKVASDYGMLSKQTIGTINWRSVIMTTNPNGSISYQYIDSWITDSYTIDGVDYVVYNWQQMTAKEFNEKYWWTTWTIKPYDMVDSKVFDTSPQSHNYYTLRDFIDDPSNQVWSKAWQCAKFVNNYLEKIWVGRYFGNENIQTRQSRCNSNTAKVWTIAVFDYNHKSDDWINHGHVGIVTKVDADWKGFRVLDSNYDVNNPWTVKERHILNWSSSLKGFFDPSQPPSASKTSWSTWDIFTRNDGTEFDVWNSEIYNSLDNRWKQAVQQLLNNSLARTAITKRNWYSDPEWILTAVSEINPAWSESDYNNRKTAEANRAKLEIGWATSRNATAATTAKRVYDLLDDITDKDLKRTWINTINDLINATSKEFWNEKIVELQTLLNWLQSEAAGALKWGNAAISDKDKEDMQAVFNANLTNWQLKKAMETMIRLLYDKNESEAKAIYNYWFYKKKPIWTDEINEWMTNDLWIDLSVYYDYNSWSTWPEDIRARYFDWLYTQSSVSDSNIDFILNG